MQKKLGLGTVFALAFAVAVIMVTPAASSGSGSGDDDHIQVIRVHAVTVQESFNDVGDPGPSLGDQFVSSQDFFRHGTKVASAGVVCTLVRVEETGATALCQAAADFAQGQLTAQVLLHLTEGPQTSTWAITGGTGHFKEAGGQLKSIDVSETESVLIFKVTD
jgi:hypothetical protein